MRTILFFVFVLPPIAVSAVLWSIIDNKTYNAAVALFKMVMEAIEEQTLRTSPQEWVERYLKSMRN